MSLSPAALKRAGQDYPWYAEHLLHVVDEDGELVLLRFRPAQWKVWRAVAAQRAAGLPVRIIVLKSRKTGVSTEVQGMLVQAGQLLPRARALVVAQNNDTAGELFDIGDTMYQHLPDDVPELRRDLMHRRNSAGGQKFMQWGTPREWSQLKIDTAKEVEAGRGKTISHLHCSEVAFWQDPRKALSLLNAVPDRPGTLIVLESTANGHNFFKARWDRAVRGLGGYAPVFIGWQEDENCRLPIPDGDVRAELERTLGKMPEYGGEEELRLVDRGFDLEQLYWRRKTIIDKADGDIPKFKQEYPSTPQEAFIASGRHVFSVSFTDPVIQRTEKTDPAGVDGYFYPLATKVRRLMHGEIEVPDFHAAEPVAWTPKSEIPEGLEDRSDYWRVWEMPREDRAYIVSADPARDEEAGQNDKAFNAAQVIDHLTGEQVARYRSRQDTDEFAREIVLAGLFFNLAHVVPEVTGIGTALAKVWLWEQYGYPRIYTRKRLDSQREKFLDALGFDTNRKTKPLIEASAQQLLREGTDGIRCRLTALEFTTYVKLEDGSHGPDEEAYSDLLLAWMVGEYVRGELPPARPRKRKGGAPSSLPRSLRPNY